MKNKDNPSTDTLEAAGAEFTQFTPLKKDFLTKFFDNVGNVKKTCEAVGISRMAYYQWRHKDKDFETIADFIKDASRQSIIDDAEDGLRSGVEAGNMTAIIFTLKTIGKERGYVERIENETYNMTPADFAQQLIDEKRKLRTQH